jgi:hypothetical protein
MLCLLLSGLLAFASPVAAAGTGLYGSYYNNVDFTDFKIGRTDATVNFDWLTTGSPDVSMYSNTFSVVWQGFVQSTCTGNVFFRTTSDDGVRLYVNGVLIINNWNDHSVATDTSAAVAMVSGTQYTVRMEFYENYGQATTSLSWNPCGAGYAIIPQAQLYSTPIATPTPTVTPTAIPTV